MPSPYFLIRTQCNPMGMAETLRRKIRQIDPARSVFGISPLEEHLSDSFSENRLRAILLTLFAATAVSLACIGLYGTMSARWEQFLRTMMKCVAFHSYCLAVY